MKKVALLSNLVFAGVLAAAVPTFTLAAPAAADAGSVRPLLVGSTVPDVALTDPAGEPVRLLELVGRQPAVLIFYRGGWCPYCNLHLGQLQQVNDDLVALGYQILAISPDDPAHLATSVQDQSLEYRLLSDRGMVAARAFGVAFHVSEEMLARGAEILETYAGDDHHLLPVPSVFLVGRDGVIRFQYVNPDYEVRLPPEVLLAAARAFAPPSAAP